MIHKNKTYIQSFHLYFQMTYIYIYLYYHKSITISFLNRYNKSLYIYIYS